MSRPRSVRTIFLDVRKTFFLSRQESENLMKCCKKGHLGWKSSDGKYLATKLDSQINVIPFFKRRWEGSWLYLQRQHFSHKILERKGLVGVNVVRSKDIFYVTMKTGLRSGETVWEQWPQICHHEHYTQVDHAVFVHLEHHHQLYHHQIITFANIDI